MDNFTENTDKRSLYVLRNFTAVTFAALLIAGSTLSILGITMTIVPKWFNIMLLLLTVSGATLALLRRISRATLLSFCIIVFAIELSGEMVYLATQSSYHAIFYISADATQALSIILLSLTGLNKRVVAIAGSIVFITWSAICLIVKGDLWDIYVINAVIFAAATLYGYFAIERIIDVVARYNDLTEERNMMHAMQHMTHDQLNALIKLGLKNQRTAVGRASSRTDNNRAAGCQGYSDETSAQRDDYHDGKVERQHHHHPLTHTPQAETCTHRPAL